MSRWVLAGALLWCLPARADQGWQDNQDGNGFTCTDVGYFQANNLAGFVNSIAVADSTGKIISFPTLPNRFTYNGNGVLDLEASTNGPAIFILSNTNSGSSALSRFALGNDSGNNVVIAYHSIAGGSGTTWEGPGGSHGLVFIEPYGVGFASAAFPTNATAGFFQFQSMNGPPTGVPSVLNGEIPAVFDYAHNTLYCYNGSWVQCDPSGAGAAINALSHDVTAVGPGSVTAEVTGITDASSVDWQVTGPFSNGKALGMVGGGLQAVSFQAPLTACTDYVSVSCQGGSSDIGTTGSNSAVPVIGFESGAAMRGSILATEIATPSVPAASKILCWAGNFSDNWMCEDHTGNVNHGIRDVSCSAGNFVSAVTANGASTCSDAFVGKVSVDGADAAARNPDYLNAKLQSSSSIAIVPTGTADQHLQFSIAPGALEKPVSYYVNSTIPGSSSGWMATAVSSTFSSTAIEYPLTETLISDRVALYVSKNTLTCSGGTFGQVLVSQNGSTTSLGVTINCTTTTGLVDSGASTLAGQGLTGASTDSWGLKFLAPTVTGGSLEFTAVLTGYY